MSAKPHHYESAPSSAFFSAMAHSALKRSGPISILDLSTIIELAQNRPDTSIVDYVCVRLQKGVLGMTNPHPMTGKTAIRSNEAVRMFLDEYQKVDKYTLAESLNLIIQGDLREYFKFAKLPAPITDEQRQNFFGMRHLPTVFHVFCQAWEYSSSYVKFHGYTLHLSMQHHARYMGEHWDNRSEKVPDSYVFPAIYEKVRFSIVQIPGDVYMNLLKSRRNGIFTSNLYPVWLDLNDPTAHKEHVH